MQIRETTLGDLDELLKIQQEAFGDEKGVEIADLVNGLLNDPSARPLLSLLAVREEQGIGHILFTKANLVPGQDSVSAVILAPLAVIPKAQSQGVGSNLIQEGLKRLANSGVDLVFVLGYPDYYARHGFKPAGIRGFAAPYPIPEEQADAWMVQELTSGVIGRVKGKVVCADALSQPEYWRE